LPSINEAKRVERAIEQWFRFPAAVLTSVTAQLLLFFQDLDPPWPAGVTGVVKFVSTVLVVIAALSMSSSRSRALATRMLVTGVVMCFLYLFAYGSFVVTDTQFVKGVEVNRRWVVGSELRPGFAPQGKESQMLGPRDYLARGGYVPENVWTRKSLMFARLALLVTFSLAIASVTAGFTLLAGTPLPR